MQLPDERDDVDEVPVPRLDDDRLRTVLDILASVSERGGEVAPWMVRESLEQIGHECLEKRAEIERNAAAPSSATVKAAMKTFLEAALSLINLIDENEQPATCQAIQLGISYVGPALEGHGTGRVGPPLDRILDHLLFRLPIDFFRWTGELPTGTETGPFVDLVERVRQWIDPPRANTTTARRVRGEIKHIRKLLEERFGPK